MEWLLTDAQRFAQIDQQVAPVSLAPAEYEVVRRVIYETGDVDYLSLLHFSERALSVGATAFASRCPIVVDVPMLQVGILPFLQQTFANPIYCAAEVFLRPQYRQNEQGMILLAKRFPEAVFVVGQSSAVLSPLESLIVQKSIRPALLINTVAGFDTTAMVQNFPRSLPQIVVKGGKGGVGVAVAIMGGLIDLAWQAYRQTITSQE